MKRGDLVMSSRDRPAMITPLYGTSPEGHCPSFTYNSTVLHPDEVCLVVSVASSFCEVLTPSGTGWAHCLWLRSVE